MRSCRRRDGARRCNRSLNCFGGASSTFFEHDRDNSPAPAPMSVGHEAFFDRWVRNQGHAPDPHIGRYLERCTSFIRAGQTSALEHDLSTEEERRTLPFFLETARPESGSGSRPRFSQSTAATGAWASTAETTRLRPKTRHASARSVPISPKSSVWRRSLRLSTPPRSFQRWSESAPPPSFSTRPAAQPR